MRKICYISGTRADYGLMQKLLQKIAADSAFDLSILVTGMHLSDLYGSTVNEIIADGFTIAGSIPVDVDSSQPSTMSKAIGHNILGFTEVLEALKPDILMLLGDRGEMLAAAISAAHLNIPIVHIHGGERSGTVDEMVRHAISKFAHYHFTATEEARNRLIRMGEQESAVFAVGAPGLDEILERKPISKALFFQEYGFQEEGRKALLVFHPVVQNYEEMSQQMQDLLQAVLDASLETIALLPNSDAGGHFIREVLLRYETNPKLRIIKHLQRSKYLDCLANVDLMIGNSSSGIIEAASFNLPVVNIGSRQNLRERSNNVFEAEANYASISQAIKTALEQKNPCYQNVYGDGKSSERCLKLLKSLSLEPTVLNKYNAY